MHFEKTPMLALTTLCNCSLYLIILSRADVSFQKIAKHLKSVLDSALKDNGSTLCLFQFVNIYQQYLITNTDLATNPGTAGG